MPHTVKKLAPGFAALCDAAQVSSVSLLNLDKAAASAEVIKVLEAISGLPDDKWAALPADAQKLFDAAAEATNGNSDPTDLCILTVEEKDETSKTAPAKAAVARKAPATQAVKSEATGETKTATEAPKGRFGGGARKNPATDWARNYVVDHPEASAGEVHKATLEQNFPIPISKGTADSLVFEMRNCMRILKERNLLK